MRKLLVALTLAALAGLAPITSPISPATAHHEWDFPHWRATTHPVVRTPSCYVWGNPTNFCDIVADAAYFWQDRGFWRGYTPPLPKTGYTRCDNVAWDTINVCFVDKAHEGLRDPATGVYGIGRFVYWTYDFMGEPQHLSAVQVFICANCQTEGTSYQAHINQMKVTLRHEMGHALGLGHTYEERDCIMNAPTVYVGVHEGTCQHDIDSMVAMYNHSG
jgi:hypothetical protein